MPGRDSSRRNSLATSRAARLLSSPFAPGSGSCTNSTSASLPKLSSKPPNRPIATIAIRVGSGARRSASIASHATVSAASRVAAVISVRATPTASTSTRPSSSPTAIRNSSRRRIARMAVTASTGSVCRWAAAVISFWSAARDNGWSASSLASIRTPSGARSSRSVA